MDADQPPPAPLEYQRPGRSQPWWRTPVPRHVAAMTIGGLLLLGAVASVRIRISQREYAKLWERRDCASHLHDVGVAILLFCQDHGGRYPDTLADLVSGEGLGPGVLVCQQTADVPATLPNASPTSREVVAAIGGGGHQSYVYAGAGWTDRTVPADAVVAYEPVADHGDGANVLFGDGTVTFVLMPRAARLIAAASATTRPVSAATVP